MLKTKTTLMKTFILTLVFGILSCITVSGQQNITDIEYFFDLDPGAGNAINIDVIDAVSLNESFIVPVTNLSSGIHTLHMRTKNEFNQWSIYARQAFYIANFSSTLNNTIVEAEYFFDVDPGLGNGTPVNLPSGGSLTTSLALPINTISNGIHTFHIRVKNDLNQWSLYARQVFYKSPQILNHELIAAEYFIDVDPGIGNATSVTITQSASVDELLNIAIPEDLAEGDHVLHLRVQRNDGTWSLYGRPEFTSTLSVGSLIFENFKMYPNPVEDVLNLSISNATLEQVKVIDLNGKIVWEQSNNLEHLNVSKLASGVYLVQIKTSSGAISKKIIKK